MNNSDFDMARKMFMADPFQAPDGTSPPSAMGYPAGLASKHPADVDPAEPGRPGSLAPQTWCWQNAEVDFSFSSQLWIWDARKSDSWFFLTVPEEYSDALRAGSIKGSGFGSIRVEVTVGQTTWATSVFPDKASGCYVLPVKASVRRAEKLDSGDEVSVRLTAI